MWHQKNSLSRKSALCFLSFFGKSNFYFFSVPGAGKLVLLSVCNLGRSAVMDSD